MIRHVIALFGKVFRTGTPFAIRIKGFPGDDTVIYKRNGYGTIEACEGRSPENAGMDRADQPEKKAPPSGAAGREERIRGCEEPIGRPVRC